MSSKKVTVVYTDGSCPDNGKKDARGGCGVYFGKDDKRNAGFALPGKIQSSQRAELRAAIYALENTEGLVEIRSDSQYVISGCTQWMRGWIRNGWINSKGDPVANKDLWLCMLKCLKSRRVKFTKVKGHSGDKGNDEADRLAKRGVLMNDRYIE